METTELMNVCPICQLPLKHVKTDNNWSPDNLGNIVEVVTVTECKKCQRRFTHAYQLVETLIEFIGEKQS